ncbi:LAETG motif-containing sortase-dependent surface protein [Kitasatospora sp. NPDC001660]
MRTRITTLVLSGLTSAALVWGGGGAAYASPAVDLGATSNSVEAQGEWVDSLLRLAGEGGNSADGARTSTSRGALQPALTARPALPADGDVEGDATADSPGPDSVESANAIQSGASAQPDGVVPTSENGAERGRPMDHTPALGLPESTWLGGEHGLHGHHGFPDFICLPGKHGERCEHKEHKKDCDPCEHKEHKEHKKEDCDPCEHKEHKEHGEHKEHDGQGQSGKQNQMQDQDQDQSQSAKQNQAQGQDQHTDVNVTVQNTVANTNSATSESKSSANNLTKIKLVAEEVETKEPHKAVHHGEHEAAPRHHEEQKTGKHHHGELAETGSQKTPILFGLSAAFLAAGMGALRISRRRA